MLLLKSVDYGRMAEILVQRAASPDEFTRLTAITWVSRKNHASAWPLPVTYMVNTLSAQKIHMLRISAFF